MSTSHLIEVRELTFYRGNKCIFDSINLTIPKGKIVGIMGPSGTGKTTLLRLIGRQLSPTKGSILIDNVNINELSRLELFNIRKKMGMLFQSGALFTDLTVFENVAFPLRIHTNLTDIMIRDIVLMKLQAVGLRGAADMMPNELSGGMSRRAALARAIALDPSLVMYDEPFAGQDPIAMGVLVTLIRKLNQALDITSIIVSHDLNETASIADYLYIIADKKIIGHGTPEQMQQSTKPQIMQFMQGHADGPVPFHYPSKNYKKDLLKEDTTI